MSDPYRPAFGEPVGPWFRWFAWRPISTEDRGLRWLRFVWRRRCQLHDYLPAPVTFWFQHVCADPDYPTPGVTHAAADERGAG